MQDLFLNNAKYVIIFTLLVIATLVVAYLVNRFFARLIRRSSQDLKSDPTNYKFLKHLSTGAVYLIGFSSAIYTIPELRSIASSMLAGAGIFAVAIGFAAQNALSNIISGFFIIIFKPFRINDRLTIRDTMTGIVEDITLRHTVIRNFENRRIVVPNSIISNEIILNADFVDESICKWIDIGISYNSDIDKAKTILFEEVSSHPLFLDNRTPQQKEEGAPIVTVRVVALAESSVNLRAWAWAKDTPSSFILGCDLLESIKKRFDQEGIIIPFPHRTLVHQQADNDS